MQCNLGFHNPRIQIMSMDIKVWAFPFVNTFIFLFVPSIDTAMVKVPVVSLFLPFGHYTMLLIADVDKSANYFDCKLDTII